MTLLTRGMLNPNLHPSSKIERAKKCVMKYHWLVGTLYFQNLVVPKLEERKEVIEKMHNEIRHFGKLETLIEAKRIFFWYEKIRL